MKEYRVDVEFVGIDELKVDGFIKAHIEDIVKRNAKKFGQLVKNNGRLKVQIKQYKATFSGKQHKCSVKVHLAFPGMSFAVDKAYGWDINVAVHKAMADMENKIRHRFHD